MRRTGALAGAALATVLVLGLLLGVGQAMADSLPGEALYNLKLAVAQARLKWTKDPDARTDLALDVVGERLNEIATTIKEGQSMDGPTTKMLQEHFEMALSSVDKAGDEGASWSEEHNRASIQNWYRHMAQMMDELSAPGEAPVRDLARETERLRLELHAGQGQPEGEQARGRYGEPNDATPAIDGSGQAGSEPQGPMGPQAGATPAGAGPQAAHTPAAADETPEGPGPQATDQPGGAGAQMGEGNNPGHQDGSQDQGSGGNPDSGGSDSQGGGSPENGGNGGGQGKP